MPGSALPLPGKCRVLIAVEQAPRDADGNATGDPLLHACIPIDDLAGCVEQMRLWEPHTKQHQAAFARLVEAVHA